MENTGNLKNGQRLSFKVTGEIVIPAYATIFYNSIGEIAGFTLPNGKDFRLQVALEVNEGQEILTTNVDMGQYGIEVTEYFDTSFEEDSQEEENPKSFPEYGQSGYRL